MTAWSMLLIFFFSVCVFLLSLYFSGSVNTYLQSSAPLIFRHYVQKEKKKRHFFKCAVFLFFFLFFFLKCCAMVSDFLPERC